MVGDAEKQRYVLNGETGRLWVAIELLTNQTVCASLHIHGCFLNPLVSKKMTERWVGGVVL